MSSDNDIGRNFRNKFSPDDSGVSPVIGVILMVAITVALVALVTVTVFDLGGDVGASPDATVQFDESSSTISAQVLRNENVESFKLVDPDGSTIGTTSDIGGSIEDSSKKVGDYKIIAVMSDGSEEVLTSKSVESTSAVTGISGTVSINPDINGATVEAVDTDGNVLSSTTTDSNGEYTISQNPSNVDEIVVSVEGFSSGATSNPLYASASLKADSGTVSVDFDETNTFDYTVDGSSVTVIYNGSGTESDPYQVGNLKQLQAMNNSLDKNYELVRDIDASSTSSWNSGSGFEPVGDLSNKFTGSFDGQNYTINSLYIDRPSSRFIGLFGFVGSGSTVENVGMTNVDITGKRFVGGLVGINNGGSVSSSYATGSVTGSGNSVGGLVGSNSGGSVSSSYATASVSGGPEVGGLVGNNNGDVSSSYSTGSVSGTDFVGGLAGSNSGSVSSSYSTGSVSGSSDVGGLVGNNNNGGSVSSSYWDTESTGQSSSAGSATGLTTSEMQGDTADDNMSGFDFSGTWSTVSGEYPILDLFDQSTQINNR